MPRPAAKLLTTNGDTSPISEQFLSEILHDLSLMEPQDLEMERLKSITDDMYPEHIDQLLACLVVLRHRLFNIHKVAGVKKASRERSAKARVKKKAQPTESYGLFGKIL